MINKFAIRNLFLVLIGFFSLCLFGYECEKSFASLANDKKYQDLGIELARARSKVKERLETTPAELLSPLAPSFSSLENIDVRQIKKESKLIPGSFLSAKSLKPILEIFEKYRGDADFVFVGNGYYIPYLMAKSMFAGTPMESRIKFVAFSRELAGKAAAKPEQFENYFKSIGLGESKRKMVVIDSITSLDSGNDHSVIRTSNAIRSFLMAQGWPPSEAIQSVITLGMPEGNAQQAYRAQSLEEYAKKLSEVTAKKARGRLTLIGIPEFPMNKGLF